MAAGAAGVDAGERTAADVETDPDREPERDERELALQLRVGGVARRRRRWQCLPPVPDEAEDARLVIRDRGPRVGLDLDVDARQRARLPVLLGAVPAADRDEVHRLALAARAHAKRAAADQGLRFRRPRVLAGGGDDLAVDDPERPQPDQRQEVAAALAELHRERRRVDRGQTAHLRRAAVRDCGVAGDDVEQSRVVALPGGRAVPAVDEVVGGDRIAVGKVRVRADVEGVGHAVGGDRGLAQGEVRELPQPGVELVETGEDVAQYVDVGRGRHHRRVEVGDVLRDGEAQRLVVRQWLGRRAGVAGWVAGDRRQDEREQAGSDAHPGKATSRNASGRRS